LGKFILLLKYFFSEIITGGVFLFPAAFETKSLPGIKIYPVMVQSMEQSLDSLLGLLVVTVTHLGAPAVNNSKDSSC
jgi:hypothetical protein